MDDRAGVIVDVLVTTGETNESSAIERQLINAADNTSLRPAIVTADSGYAYGKVYALIEGLDAEPLIPPKAEMAPQARIPIRRFKYDAKHQVVRCPRGKILLRSTRVKHGWFYRSRAHQCRDCPIRNRCFSPSQDRRSISLWTPPKIKQVINS